MSIPSCSAVLQGAMLLGALLCGTAYADQAPASQTQFAAAPAQETAAEFILRGHRSLYREGTTVVKSSEKAFSYAREHSIVSSGQAISQALAGAKSHSGEYAGNLKADGKSGVQTTVDVYKRGTDIRDAGVAAATGLVKAEWDYGSSTLRSAWECCLKGALALRQRTAEDLQALRAVPGYKDLGNDFGNLYDLTDAAMKDIGPHIEAGWGKAYAEARTEFNAAYQQSGTEDDPISGSIDLVVGWGKALYAGLAKPAARSVAQGANASASVAAKVVFLPVAGAFLVAGRTIESTGLSLYYATSMGIKVVSPTVEGGLLTGLAMLSYGSTVPTVAVGTAAGVVNEVAVLAAAPAAGAGAAIGGAAADTGKYAAQVTYDLTKGVTKVTINQAQSGVVLGYNAATAIPAHLLMVVGDVAFLAWEGGKLVVKTAHGNVQSPGANHENGGVPVSSLPVGSVVDLDALKKEPGVQVRTISDDPEVAQKVLERLPDDLREGGRP